MGSLANRIPYVMRTMNCAEFSCGLLQCIAHGAGCGDHRADGFSCGHRLDCLDNSSLGFKWTGVPSKRKPEPVGYAAIETVRVVSCTALLTERGVATMAQFVLVVLESSRRGYREIGNPSQCDLLQSHSGDCPGEFPEQCQSAFGHSKIYLVCPVVGV